MLSNFETNLYKLGNSYMSILFNLLHIHFDANEKIRTGILFMICFLQFSLISIYLLVKIYQETIKIS